MKKLMQQQLFVLLVALPLLFAACGTKPEEKAPTLSDIFCTNTLVWPL